jgi:hypothetical protein
LGDEVQKRRVLLVKSPIERFSLGESGIKDQPENPALFVAEKEPQRINTRSKSAGPAAGSIQERPRATAFSMSSEGRLEDTARERLVYWIGLL